MSELRRRLGFVEDIFGPDVLAATASSAKNALARAATMQVDKAGTEKTEKEDSSTVSGVLPKHIFCMGSHDSHIHPLLQWTGPLKNRSMSRRECEALVRQIWLAKLLWMGEKENIGKRLALRDFCAGHLLRKAGNARMASEIVYNLMKVLRKKDRQTGRQADRQRERERESE